MPKLTIFLPDVNVWLALASSRHVHSGICSSWLESCGADSVAFCRASQMGLLRLLTSRAVMGNDVLASRDAWRAYQTMLADERVVFAAEPFGVEAEWKKLTAQDRPTPKIWTDAYLAGFAQTAGMRMVTLDRAVLSLASAALLLA